MENQDTYISRTLGYIHSLSVMIGSRGSCTPQVRAAGEYISDQLRNLGLQSVRSQRFKAIASTYKPYALAFSVALIGSLLGLIFEGRSTMALAAFFNILGFWGMLAETEFSTSWIRWILPKSESQNIIAVVPPSGHIRKRAVLSAHLDTHRTPIFYSSRKWHTWFSSLVSLTFMSMVLSGVAFVVATLFEWGWMGWLGIVLVPIQAFALALCLHADSTPFSPGANDNASGAGVILGLAQRLVDRPLEHTEVHLVFTDCEECGAYGIQAYINAHASELGNDAIYIFLDEVGNGTIKYLTADGLVLKHKTHQQALELAGVASAACPGIKVFKGQGIAYTDALPATRKGLIALTICTLPPRTSDNVSHWHQMSDTYEHINSTDIDNVHRFTWKILELIDGQTSEQVSE